jgi:putative endonuclease
MPEFRPGQTACRNGFRWQCSSPPHSHVIPAQAGTHDKAPNDGWERPMTIEPLIRTPILIGRRDKVPCMYLLASKPNGILYAGVTADLISRMADHVEERFEGFTKTHGIKKLVYYEMHPMMPDAIQREKRIKEWKRAWKVRLIQGFNPEWIDLYDHASGVILDSPADAARERRT